MIRIEVQDAAVSAWLGRLAERMDDMRPVMAELGDALREASMEAFKTEAAPGGTAWKPLAPSTRRRRRGGPVHRILQDTGALRQSVTRQVEGPRSVAVGSRLSYAPYHMTGTSRMPARPFLGVSPEARADIIDAITDWLEGAG